ncbi:hypothetical protein TNCT_654841 [Trichonephila clavata]|uniref:Uncharacterized protein n=1 Tax=Trichonephila clavata TaxID=2740835 RepID=A0A8X6F0G6_TRICU|nr:hypothetical protein TNCT_654841 [Trichonephila clavata]
MAIKERQLAVMEAENLKLRIHRESKKTLQHLIKDDMVKVENDISLQQIEYWAMYLPKHFFGGYEHLALQDTNNKFDTVYLSNECNSLELHEIVEEVQSICNLARRGENLELYHLNTNHYCLLNLGFAIARTRKKS